MKLVRKMAAVAATMFVALSASLVVAESDAHKTFDMLKTMEGNWAGKNNQGQLVELTFRMTAGGSALMSEIHGHGPENMITMFHMDGDRLLMTHYCGAGNQPRMKWSRRTRSQSASNSSTALTLVPARVTCSTRPSRNLTPITTLKSGSSSIMARR
jgi:hypothetical protein